MQFKNVVIESMAYALPADRWTSERIEEELNEVYRRLKLPQGRLEMMTGIRERRHWERDFPPSEAAILAGQKVLATSELARDQVDVLINASVCRNRLEPSTAAYVHRGLGLGASVQIFDLSNACLGVLNALVVGAAMIEAGVVGSVLIVAGENGRPLLDWTLDHLKNDRSLTRRSLKPFFANLTIGSGAVGLLLCHQRLVRRPRPILLGGVLQTQSESCHLCEGDAGQAQGLSMRTEATALLQEGLALSKTTWNHFKREMSWDHDTAQRIITHQVGRQHQIKLYEALQLDRDKDFSTFAHLGNLGAAALPLALCQAEEQHLLGPAMPVLLLGIGSGLSSIMLGIQWQR
jgi:3-oxoacyl-[acyl-carrier-protein] synthase-3